MTSNDKLIASVIIGLFIAAIAICLIPTKKDEMHMYQVGELVLGCAGFEQTPTGINLTKCCKGSDYYQIKTTVVEHVF